jgi:hypothetical protein
LNTRFLSEQHSLGRSVTSSVLGFSLAGWDEPNYVVQYRSPLLVACRVLILLADPLLSWPGAATGNLDGMGAALGNFSLARNYVSAIDAFSMGSRNHFAPQHLHLLAIGSSEHAA